SGATERAARARVAGRAAPRSSSSSRRGSRAGFVRSRRAGALAFELREQRPQGVDDVLLLVSEIVQKRAHRLAQQSQLLVGHLDRVHAESLVPASSCSRPAGHLPPHMRKTPNVVSGTGAFAAAARPRASTRRVSRGSTMPSSQSRAVEKYGFPSAS